jgi:hypothetical protein
MKRLPDGPESDKPQLSFYTQIIEAMKHAPLIKPQDPFTNEKVAQEYFDKPDDYIISFGFYWGSDNEVFTREATQYPELLKQGMLVLYGTVELTDDQTRIIERILEHELAHGEATKQFGNESTSSIYGLAFYKKPDGVLTFWPYHYSTGPLKKIHHAWSAIAPEDASGIDLAIAKGLGYDINNREEIRLRALHEPAVEPRWRDDASRIKLVKAMATALMASNN